MWWSGCPGCQGSPKFPWAMGRFQSTLVSFTCLHQILLGGGFKYFFMFNPTWGNDPIWLIFFKGVETTNEFSLLTDSGNFHPFLIHPIDFGGIQKWPEMYLSSSKPTWQLKNPLFPTGDRFYRNRSCKMLHFPLLSVYCSTFFSYIQLEPASQPFLNGCLVKLKQPFPK